MLSLHKVGPLDESSSSLDDNDGALDFELVVVDGADAGKRIVLGGATFPSRVIIGTGAGCHLTLTDPYVSRRHATVQWHRGNRITIWDMSSTNGTFVDEKRIDEAGLQRGDLIRVGKTFLGIGLLRDSAPTRPVRALKVVTEPHPSDAGVGFANQYLERLRTKPIKIG